MTALPSGALRSTTDPLPAAVSPGPARTRPGDGGCLDAGFGEPVRYRLHGNTSCAPIAVLGGISADRFCERWWSPVVGPDGALDPRHRRILSFDWLAAGPSAAGEVSTADQADALARVLDHLGMERMEALVGASYGAMVGLAFAARHPGRLGRLIAISGAHRSTPSATARRLVQREIIRLAETAGKPADGVALARALALTTYRTGDEFDQRFFRSEPGQTVGEIEAYFRHKGEQFARGCNARRYQALSASLDAHCVEPAAIACPVDLVGIESDELVPLGQLRRLAGAIGFHCRLHVVDSPFGHDAFLKSPERINPLIRRLIHASRENRHGIA